MLVAGDRFGGLIIQRLLGRGGMGEVYLARDPRIERSVALKILHGQYVADPSFRERFIRESRVAVSLEHPHIIPVYDAGLEGDQLYLVMRYIDGWTLADVMAREGPLPVPRTATILEQIGSALGTAHVRGLVHRDVKPANVIVGPGTTSASADFCYLGDFGIVRPIGDVSLTASGAFVGTFEYAAPEQFKGEPVDARTDIYALGCVIYEALAGQPPFHGRTSVQLMYAHLEETPRPVSDARRDVPPGVDDVLSMAMAKDAQDRYPTTGAFIASFRSAMHDDPSGSWTSVTKDAPVIRERTQPVDAPVQSPVQRPQYVEMTRPLPARRTGGSPVAWAVAIIALSVLGGIVALAATGNLGVLTGSASPDPTSDVSTEAPITAGPTFSPAFTDAPLALTAEATPPADAIDPAVLPTKSSDGFTIKYPNGWTVGAPPNPTTVDLSLIPSDGNDAYVVRVDQVFDGRDAQQIVADNSSHLAKKYKNAYHELGISASALDTPVQQIPGWEWDYTIERDGVLTRNVNFTFEYGQGRVYAILTRAPEQDWHNWDGWFRAIRNSINPS